MTAAKGKARAKATVKVPVKVPVKVKVRVRARGTGQDAGQDAGQGVRGRMGTVRTTTTNNVGNGAFDPPDVVAALAQGGVVDKVSLTALLTGLLRDPATPAAAKANATRTLAEMGGMIGRHQRAPDRTRDTALDVLDRAGLAQELARLRRVCGV